MGGAKVISLEQAKPVVKQVTAAAKKAQATAKKDAKKVKAVVKKDEVAAAKGFQGGVKKAVAYEKKYLINAKTLAKDASTDFETYAKQVEAEQKKGAKVISLEQAKPVANQVAAAVKKAEAVVKNVVTVVKKEQQQVVGNVQQMIINARAQFQKVVKQVDARCRPRPSKPVSAGKA